MQRTHTSSKIRHTAYLEQRAADARKSAAKAAKAADAAPAKAKADWTEDTSGSRQRKAGRPVATLLREFIKLVKPYRTQVVFALCTLTLSTLLGLLMPLSTKIAFDYIIADKPGPEGLQRILEPILPSGITVTSHRMTLLWILGGSMLVITVLAALIGTSGRYQMTRISQLLRARVRRQLFGHLADLPLHRIQAMKSGGVSSLLREDAGMIGEMLFSVLYNPLRAVITFSGGLVAMALLDWRMLVGGLLSVPAVYFSHRAWIGRIRPIHRAIKMERQATDSHATEAFAGIRVVRSFGGQFAEALRFTTSNHSMARKDMLIWFWSRWIELAWIVMIPVATAGVMIYGGKRVMEGSLTIGDLAAFTAYLLMLLGPLEVLVSTASGLQNSLAAWDRCLDVFSERTELANSSAPANEQIKVVKANTRGDMTVRNVAFRYPGHEQYVLTNINLDIKAGQTVALVGPSGSGKTTLCNLIARFYDVSEGIITLDGIDVRKVDLVSFRSLLGIVEQDVFLFDGTVAENIAYGIPEASDERIITAAKAANAHEFIERLEKHYETLIGERGVRLSGGQKQRIAIARALLADPKLLILDEATSNLDTESERLIQRSLVRLTRSRTCIVIAHRLSTIRHADLIVVLERGEIIETGTHDQLTAKGGRYAEMLMAQIDPATTLDD